MASLSVALKDTGAFFTSLLSKAKSISKFLASHSTQIKVAADTAVAVVSAVDPAVATLATDAESLGETVLGQIYNAITAGTAVAGADGLNVTLDLSLVNDIKAVFATVGAIHGPGSLTPPSAAATPAPSAVASPSLAK